MLEVDRLSVLDAVVVAAERLSLFHWLSCSLYVSFFVRSVLFRLRYNSPPNLATYIFLAINDQLYILSFARNLIFNFEFERSPLDLDLSSY
jgi:hypothetical protein